MNHERSEASRQEDLAWIDLTMQYGEEGPGEDLGLGKRVDSHFTRPAERVFTRTQRKNTTILFGGLTLTHEHILKGAMLGLGYTAEHLPCPDNEALAIGKEYCNRGECNPTYYTVGNLIKYLRMLTDRGMCVKEIEARYVFLTAGSCGPCRFGMYEAEYRKALCDAGFGNFRVILFQQSAGLYQASEEAGLQMNGKFFVTILKALMVADLLNEIGYKIRPYEVRKGETDRIALLARDTVFTAFENRTSILRALREARKMLGQIEVDYLRVKAKVKIIGEFWAQTTEGDGNYHMARWLEEEGAETVIDPISTWIQYLISSARLAARDRIKVERGKRWLIIRLVLANLAFRSVYNLYRAALGFKADPLPSMKTLGRYAEPYYNTRLTGGEGHLEVAKTIMATIQKKAHMVLSIKPFGCMPSTQSDGIQSKVTFDIQGCVFASIETSGDSEVNVRSRVQMKLFEARQTAQDEFDKVMLKRRLDLEWQHRIEGISSLAKGNVLWRIPNKVVGTAANFVCFGSGNWRGIKRRFSAALWSKTQVDPPM